MSIIKNIRLLIGIIGSVVLVAITLLLVDMPRTAESAPSDNLSGYAWSDNIGWISMNCTDENCGSTNYGVRVAPDGTLSGYAWSDNIGWISFNAADVNGCLEAPCTPTLNRTTGEVTGWAKAIAGGGLNAGGWDGYIRLSGMSSSGDRYFVSVTNCAWGGYAWGSDVVGWIDFDGHARSVTGTGDACVTLSYPNLTPESFNPAGPFTKDTAIALSGTVRNTGGVTTGTGFSDNFTYRWSATDPWQEIALKPHAALAPNETAPDNDSFTPDRVGELYLQYCVDATSALNEGAAGEANNCMQRGPFTVTDPGGPQTQSLSGTDCTIQAGQSSCLSLVNWTTTNYTDPIVELDGSTISTDPNSPSGGRTTRIDGAGDHTLTIQDGSGAPTITDTITASCANGTNWVGGVCSGSTTVVPGTPSLKAAPRIVEEGRDTTLTWDTNSDPTTFGTPETSCVLTGGAFGVSGVSVPGGGVIDQGSIDTPVTANTTYTITCPAGGSSASVRVEVIPRYFPS